MAGGDIYLWPAGASGVQATQSATAWSNGTTVTLIATSAITAAIDITGLQVEMEMDLSTAGTRVDTTYEGEFDLLVGGVAVATFPFAIRWDTIVGEAQTLQIPLSGNLMTQAGLRVAGGAQVQLRARGSSGVADVYRVKCLIRAALPLLSDEVVQDWSTANFTQPWYSSLDVAIVGTKVRLPTYSDYHSGVQFQTGTVREIGQDGRVVAKFTRVPPNDAGQNAEAWMVIRSDALDTHCWGWGWGGGGGIWGGWYVYYNDGAGIQYPLGSGTVALNVNRTTYVSQRIDADTGEWVWEYALDNLTGGWTEVYRMEPAIGFDGARVDVQFGSGYFGTSTAAADYTEVEWFNGIDSTHINVDKTGGGAAGAQGGGIKHWLVGKSGGGAASQAQGGGVKHWLVSKSGGGAAIGQAGSVSGKKPLVTKSGGGVATGAPSGVKHVLIGAAATGKVGGGVATAAPGGVKHVLLGGTTAPKIGGGIAAGVGGGVRTTILTFTKQGGGVATGVAGGIKKPLITKASGASAAGVGGGVKHWLVGKAGGGAAVASANGTETVLRKTSSYQSDFTTVGGPIGGSPVDAPVPSWLPSGMNYYASTAGTIQASGGKLRITDDGTWTGIYTPGWTTPLDSAAMTVEQTSAQNTEIYLASASHDTDTLVIGTYKVGGLAGGSPLVFCSRIIGGVYGDYFEVAVTLPVRVQMRRSGGNVIFEYGPPGGSMTVLNTIAEPAYVSAAQFVVNVVADGTETAIIDDLNVIPSAFVLDKTGGGIASGSASGTKKPLVTKAAGGAAAGVGGGIKHIIIGAAATGKVGGGIATAAPSGLKHVIQRKTVAAGGSAAGAGGGDKHIIVRKDGPAAIPLDTGTSLSSGTLLESGGLSSGGFSMSAGGSGSLTQVRDKTGGGVASQARAGGVRTIALSRSGGGAAAGQGGGVRKELLGRSGGGAAVAAPGGDRKVQVTKTAAGASAAGVGGGIRHLVRAKAGGGAAAGVGGGIRKELVTKAGGGAAAGVGGGVKHWAVGKAGGGIAAAAGGGVKHWIVGKAGGGIASASASGTATLVRVIDRTGGGVAAASAAGTRTELVTKTGGGAIAAYFDDIALPGALGVYSFDAASGTTETDRSGNGRTATLSATAQAAYQQPGTVGNALGRTPGVGNPAWTIASDAALRGPVFAFAATFFIPNVANPTSQGLSLLRTQSQPAGAWAGFGAVFFWDGTGPTQGSVQWNILSNPTGFVQKFTQKVRPGWHTAIFWVDSTNAGGYLDGAVAFATSAAPYTPAPTTAPNGGLVTDGTLMDELSLYDFVPSLAFAQAYDNAARRTRGVRTTLIRKTPAGGGAAGASGGSTRTILATKSGGGACSGVGGGSHTDVVPKVGGGIAAGSAGGSAIASQGLTGFATMGMVGGGVKTLVVTVTKQGGGAATASASGDKHLLARRGIGAQGGAAIASAGGIKHLIRAKLGGGSASGVGGGVRTALVTKAAGAIATAAAGGVKSILRSFPKLGGGLATGQAGGARTALRSASGGGVAVGVAGGAKVLTRVASGGAQAIAQAGGVKHVLITKAGGAATACSAGGDRQSGNIQDRTGGGSASLTAGAVKTLARSKLGGAQAAGSAAGSKTVFILKTGGAMASPSASGVRRATILLAGGGVAALEASGDSFLGLAIPKDGGGAIGLEAGGRNFGNLTFDMLGGGEAAASASGSWGFIIIKAGGGIAVTRAADRLPEAYYLATLHNNSGDVASPYRTGTYATGSRSGSISGGRRSGDVDEPSFDGMLEVPSRS